MRISMVIKGFSIVRTRLESAPCNSSCSTRWSNSVSRLAPAASTVLMFAPHAFRPAHHVTVQSWLSAGTRNKAIDVATARVLRTHRLSSRTSS